MPRGRRSFSAEFKAQRVLEWLTGTASQAEICRKHQLSPQTLTHWKAIILERIHTLFEGDGQPDPAQLRVTELEQLVGRQAYELEILKRGDRPGLNSGEFRLHRQ
jgi:transposase-like protein